MICESCKERPATVMISKSHMGEKSEHHLCEKCAMQSEAFQFEPNQEPLSIQQFLSHWFGGSGPFAMAQPRTGTPISHLECPNCHLTFQRFLDIGKFGCAVCYRTFKGRLPDVFKKIHNGHSSHAGKVPASFNEMAGIKKKIDEIRMKMKEAVEQERFEEAAALRDEAKALEFRLESGGGEADVY